MPTGRQAHTLHATLLVPSLKKDKDNHRLCFFLGKFLKSSSREEFLLIQCLLHKVPGIQTFAHWLSTIAH
jgi:hypothetical protein